MTLDKDAAERAINQLAADLGLAPEAAAQGILDIANEHMARALRVISIQRGHSLDAFTLCCFGGAGGLHVCDIADTLQMEKAMVPVHGGVLSAFGMLAALKSRQLTHALITPLSKLASADIEGAVSDLVNQGQRSLQAEGVSPNVIQSRPRLQLRYLGQTYYLDVPWKGDVATAAEDFHQRHRQRYGHRLDQAVELVNVSVTLQAPQAAINLPRLEGGAPAAPANRARLYLAGEWVECDLFERSSLTAGQQIPGPALIVEKVSTTLVGRGWQADVDEWGNLLLTRMR